MDMLNKQWSDMRVSACLFCNKAEFGIDANNQEHLNQICRLHGWHEPQPGDRLDVWHGTLPFMLKYEAAEPACNPAGMHPVSLTRLVHKGCQGWHFFIRSCSPKSSKMAIAEERLGPVVSRFHLGWQGSRGQTTS